MTKPREPLSIDTALAQIAGQVGGWAVMAQATGYTERTVRKWGDEDADGDIPLRSAITLDILFQQEGGEGRPLFDLFNLMSGAAAAVVYADQFEILRRVIVVAKETGDAEAALVRLGLPDATEADRRAAQKEVVEALNALKAVLPLLERAERAEAHNRGPPG